MKELGAIVEMVEIPAIEKAEVALYRVADAYQEGTGGYKAPPI